MGALKTLLGGIVARKVDPASLPSSKHVKAEPGRLNEVLKQDILKNEENEEVSTKTEPMKCPQAAHTNLSNSPLKTTNTPESTTTRTDEDVKVNGNPRQTGHQRTRSQFKHLCTHEEPCAVRFQPIQPGTHTIRTLSTSCQHPEDSIICVDCLFQHFQANTPFPPNDTIKCWAPNCPVLLTKKEIAQIDPRWVVIDEKTGSEEVDHQPAQKLRQRLDAKIQQAARESADNNGQKFLMADTKLCPGPGCSVRIEKVYGCDHMMCLSCRAEFCWYCLAPYDQIRRHGSGKHLVSCAHYR